MQTPALYSAAQMVGALGDHATAVVFFQIGYWHDGRLRVKRKGTMWLAKSREDMCRETGITLDQYKRIIPRLRDLGLIRTERGLFDNRVTPFIQLTEQGWTLLRPESANRLVVKPANQLVAPDTNQLVAHDTNLITETTSETTTETTAETATCGCLLPLPSNAPAEMGEAVIQEVKNTEKEQNNNLKDVVSSVLAMDSKQVLEQFNQKAQKTEHLKGLNGMCLLWKKHMAQETAGYQKPLAGKEVGQLKHVFKHLGDQSIEVLGWTLRHWQFFANRVSTLKGIDKQPMVPHVGFFCQHFEVATQLIAQAKLAAEKEAKLAEELALAEQQKLAKKQQAKVDKPPEPEQNIDKEAEKAEIEQMYQETMAALEAMKKGKK